VLNLNETGELRSIFPPNLTQASAYRIMAQVYQGLVAFDPGDLSIRPCIAERWEMDATATQYTFHLREGVRFHDDKAFPDGQGTEVMANDVVRCFTENCTSGIGDGVFWLFQDRIEGANTYYAATAKGERPEGGVKGIVALDDRTVRISLVQPAPQFLQILAHPGCWIWPAEMRSKYGSELNAHAIGTGPFRLKKFEPGQVMLLERDPDHWNRDPDGASLPYLDAVRVTFEDDKNLEFEAFRKGTLCALLELPVDRLTEMKDSIDPATRMPRFHLREVPSLSTQFYGFNLFRPPFDDVRVRQAFALAIDRQLLADSVLGGFAAAALHGLVAPGAVGYPYDSVPGCPFDPDSARALLAAAGYPGGAGFPRVSLQASSDGFGYVRVAEAMQAMLERELHVFVSISMVGSAEHYERIEKGQADLWREGWTADHPDPENFLALLSGRNAVADLAMPASINSTRFQDAIFDEHFNKARRMADDRSRYQELALAERRAMQQVPLMPLYHENVVYIMQPWVHDLKPNSIDFLDLTRVWIDEETRSQP
jgi:peptide/nickel transport system substrate-binding protein